MLQFYSYGLLLDPKAMIILSPVLLGITIREQCVITQNIHWLASGGAASSRLTRGWFTTRKQTAIRLREVRHSSNAYAHLNQAS